ncbi:PocR ligand-binding domain-containing protein [bacterium]|nr:PocR ligand-binding domain-containing protein [bacterium]
MLKYGLLKFAQSINVQKVFNDFRDLTGLTIAFAIQDYLQDEDEYSCPFCKECIKASEEGRKRCNKDFRRYVDAVASGALKNGFEAREFDCHAGLVDVVAPIKIGKEIVSFVCAGQYRKEQPDVKKAEQYADELKIDRKKYVECLKNVKILAPEKREVFRRMVTNIATTVSKSMETHYLLHRQILQFNVSKFIMEALYQAMNVNEIFPIVCKEIKQLFMLKSVKIVSYDLLLDSYSIWHSDDDCKVDLSPDLADKLKKFWVSKLITDDKSIPFETTLHEFTSPDTPEDISKFYKNLGINSAYVIRINKSSKINLFLVLYNGSNNNKLQDYDEKFLHDLSKGIYLAIENNLTIRKLF